MHKNNYLFCKYKFIYRRLIIKNNTIGVDITPSLYLLQAGLYVKKIGDETRTDITGAGGVSVPLNLSYNFGAGASNDYDKNLGFSIRAGIDFKYQPFIALTDDLKKPENHDVKKFFILPDVEFAIRFWPQNGVDLKEFFIGYDYVGSNVSDKLNLVLRLGARKFINY